MKKFKNLNISSKLAIFLNFTLLVFIGIFVAVEVNIQKKNLQESFYTSMQKLTEQMAIKISSSLRWRKSGGISYAYNDIVSQSDSLVASLVAFSREGDVINSYSSKKFYPYDFKEDIKEYVKTGKEIIKSNDDYFIVVTPVLFDKDKRNIGALGVAWSTHDINIKIRSSLKTTILFFFVILVALFIATNFFIKQIISNPLKEFILSIDNLSSGKITSKITYIDRVDEIGQMAQSIEKYKEDMIVKTKKEQEEKEIAIKKHSNLLAFAMQFENTINNLINFVSDIALKNEVIAKTLANNTKYNNEQIVNLVESSKIVINNSNKVTDSMLQMKNSIADINTKNLSADFCTKEAVKQSLLANNILDGFVEAEKHINGIVNLIRKFSKQINLLSLNAKIEAEKANESGRGFSVIAQEIKILASQSDKSTEEIDQSISSMHTVTEDVINVIEKIFNKITEISQISKEISSSVTRQHQYGENVSNNLQLVQASVHNINDNINRISLSSTNIETVVNTIVETSNQLVEHTHILKQNLSLFLNEIRSI
jgi:methyl-accepting chemotaxis protein